LKTRCIHTSVGLLTPGKLEFLSDHVVIQTVGMRFQQGDDAVAG
jgi:hypothetical protein